MYTVYRCMIGNGLLSQAQEESFGGATECTPCSLGSAATQQLNPTVSATAASQVQSFGAVDATSMELQCDCTGSLSFQAACATARSVNFAVEVLMGKDGKGRFCNELHSESGWTMQHHGAVLVT